MNLLDQFLRISIKDIVKMLVIAFLIHAVVDVSWKTITHKRYDMEAILKEIQKKYPQSRLTFQNIAVVDNELTESSGNRGRSSYHYKTERFYIRNGVLYQEPNYLVILFLTPIVIVGAIFLSDHPNTSLKDIPDLDDMTKNILILTPILTILAWMLISVSIGGNTYFESEVKELIDQIYINDYSR